MTRLRRLLLSLLMIMMVNGCASFNSYREAGILSMAGLQQPVKVVRDEKGMAYTYAVLGGGRQGTAAAYDMAKWGDAERVLIADISADAARASAKRVNDLVGRPIAAPFELDVTDHVALVEFLNPVDSFLSAVPYWNNPAITEAAIEARACMTDLGGSLTLVSQPGAGCKAILRLPLNVDTMPA